MGLFDKLTAPVFYMDNSAAQQQLSELNELLNNASGDVRNAIEREIRLVEAGIAGEEQVHFELMNSHIPMYVLHDLRLECNGLSAQIDYLIITKYHIFVIECKNLFGNIEINNAGDFIRTLTFGKQAKREGIYSPITQNQRHLELIKELRSETKNFIARNLFEKSFYDTYRSVVVLSNPKTILNAKYAKKEIKNQVIRADQLIAYIRKVDAAAGSIATSEKDMENLAKFFAQAHTPSTVDYLERFRNQINELESPTAPAVSSSVKDAEILCPKCGAPMIKRVATKGSNCGNEFYGCSNFPKCRGIINIK